MINPYQDTGSGNERTDDEGRRQNERADRAGETRVAHVNDQIPGTVYIGRQNGWKKLRRSFWANPYKIGGKAVHPLQKDPITREGSLLGYSIMLWETPDMLRRLPELRGKALACWCRAGDVPLRNGITDEGPDNRCHGDILVRVLRTYTDAELRRMADELEQRLA